MGVGMKMPENMTCYFHSRGKGTERQGNPCVCNGVPSRQI